jgi:hypothetical protein
MKIVAGPLLIRGAGNIPRCTIIGKDHPLFFRVLGIICLEGNFIKKSEHEDLLDRATSKKLAFSEIKNTRGLVFLLKK